MANKITIDNTSGSITSENSGISLPASITSGSSVISNSSNRYIENSASPFMRNRIVNGAMNVSQRHYDLPVVPGLQGNDAANSNPNTKTRGYAVDRFQGQSAGGHKVGTLAAGASTYFNGSTYLQYANTTALALGTGDFTVEAWIYIPASATFSFNQVSIICAGKQDTSATGGGWNVHVFDTSSAQIRLEKCLTNGTNVTYTWSASSKMMRETWVHIAVVRNSSTTTAYYNGTSLGGVSTFSGVDLPIPNSNSILVGTGQNASTVNNWPTTGYISNLRVVKGTAVYTGSFTPSTSPLTAITNTQLLTCATTEAGIDLSSNSLSTTLFYGMTGSTLSPWSQYKPSYSTYFDGTGDYLEIADNAAFEFGSGDFTVEAWVMPTAYQTSARPDGYYTSIICSKNGSFYFQLDGTPTSWSNVGCYVLNSSGTVFGIAGTYSFQNNVWYHVAFSKQGNSQKIFVNGQLLNSNNLSTGTAADNTNPVRIGTDTPTDPNWDNFFTGNISNLRLTKGSALYTANFTPSTTPLQISTNTSLLACANSTIRDQSSNAFSITTNGNAAASTMSPFSQGIFGVSRQSGWSNYFDGTGDYISFTNNSAFNPGNSDFCVEGWYNISSLSNNTNLWGCDNGAGSVPKWNMYVESNGTLHFDFTTSGGASLITTATGVISANQWTHIAVTRSGSLFNLFVNGSVVGTATSTLNLTGLTAAWTIGYIGEAYGVMLNGYVSNFRYIKGRSIYTSSFTPSSNPLYPIIGTVLLTCASEIIQDKSSNNFVITKNGDTYVSSYSPFSSHVPAGFASALRWSVVSPALSPVPASSYSQLYQRIEGTNISDLQWGTSSAKTITVSFWAKSPIAGTYCVSVQNSAKNRSYVAEYTISSVNTWEKKSITIPGDTTGTWLTSTSEGMRLVFDMGSGTNYNVTASAWSAGNYSRTSNANTFTTAALLSSISPNEFLITGVQLEVGSAATPFEVLPRQVEIALCQRYCTVLRSLSGNYVAFGSGFAQSATNADMGLYLPQPMRARIASGNLLGVVPEFFSNVTAYDWVVNATSNFALSLYDSEMRVDFYYTTSALTAGYSLLLCGNNNANAYVIIDVEMT